MNQMLTINTTKFKRITYSFIIAFVFWFFIKSEDFYTVNLDIPLGEWRYFKDNEISELNKILSKSTGVHGK